MMHGPINIRITNTVLFTTYNTVSYWQLRNDQHCIGLGPHTVIIARIGGESISITVITLILNIVLIAW